jgi:hypothetical protein
MSFTQRILMEILTFAIVLVSTLVLGWFLDAPHWASVFTALILTEIGTRSTWKRSAS